MADISAIELPDGNVYDLKDDYLRDKVGEFRLPYRQVEWVESNGHQCVQLDWVPNKNGIWGFDIDFESYNAFATAPEPGFAGTTDANHDTYGWIFGQRSANNTSDPDIGLGMYGTMAGGVMCAGKTRIAAHMYTDNRRQQCSKRGGSYTAPDGVTYTAATSTKYPNWGMCIFACGVSNNLSSWRYPGSTRIYSLKFYDDNTMTVDLIPAVRNLDSMPGLYDRISDKFHPCAGLTYGESITEFGQSNALVNIANGAIPTIMGTKMFASRLWTANAPMLDELVDGQQINFRTWWPTAKEAQSVELANRSDSGSYDYVYLKLSLSEGDTDWIPCYYLGASRLTTHYGVGNNIHLTYHENQVFGANFVPAGFWVDADYNTNTNDNARYVQWYNNILAKAAIRNASIVVGDSDGYQEIGNDVEFDLSFPILWRTAALAINKTDYAYAYTMTYDRTLATCYPSITGVKNGPLYLVGILNGGTFTVKTPLLATSEPTTADGLYYIPIGKFGNQSNGQNYLEFSTHLNPVVMSFVDGKFQQVNRLSVDTFNSRASTTDYGLTTLSTATNSTATNVAATPSSVKIAYDLADSANGTAQQALSGVNGTLIYDHTYTIANGVATFTAHVYNKGAEVTNQFNDTDFSWSYRLDNAIGDSGTPSVISLGTGKTKTINISTLGYGGHVIGTFTTT